MQQPPRLPSDTYRRWKRRQRRLMALLAVLVLLAVGLTVRGVMLLPASHATALAPTPTATPTFTPTATPTPPPAPGIQAVAGMLVDPNTGAVLFTQNANQELPMASTTKIMTVLLALKYGHLDQVVRVGADAVAEGSGDASRMGLRQGERLTLRDLLYGMLLPSGDDAAVAVADAIGGNVPHFVEMMNAQAQFLGLKHTHYANPDGLDAAGHYTSVSDLITLTEYALTLRVFASMVATYQYTIPATSQHKAYDLINTNELLGPNGYPGAEGVKTGTTGNAGDCLVFAAANTNTDLLGVVLGAPSDAARFRDARLLLDWGFKVAGS